MRSSLSLLGAAALVAAAPKSLTPLEAVAPRPLKAETPAEAAVSCVDGLYIIVARGSTEPAGEGSVMVVSDLIEAGVPNSVSVAVDYPAAILTDGGYPISVYEGVVDAEDLFKAYVDTCGSSSRIALVGYSQGGNVLTDMLAGGVLKPDPLTTDYTQYLEGIVVFGDPTFTVGESFDYGNATQSGIFSRGGDSLALLETYSDKIASYCMTNDPVCAFGTDLDVHYAEVDTFAQDAANFIISRA